MRTSWIEAKIAKGEVIVAVDPAGTPMGYCMGVDRYFKRDDVGIIHQMNVVPGRQRSFIGATLLKAMFERRCLWMPALLLLVCAGSGGESFLGGDGVCAACLSRREREEKSSPHLLAKTNSTRRRRRRPGGSPRRPMAGAMRADRIVLPIPAGVHWSDEMPVIIRPSDEPADVKRQLPGKIKKARLPLDAPTKHGPRQYGGPSAKPTPAVIAEPVAEKPMPEKKPKPKADPKLIAAARELRDRWLEKVNADSMALPGNGKYELSRALDDRAAPAQEQVPRLPAPMAA